MGCEFYGGLILIPDAEALTDRDGQLLVSFSANLTLARYQAVIRPELFT